MRALTTARRGGDEFQKGRKAMLEGVDEFFHGISIAQAGGHAKGKQLLQAFVTRPEAGQYFET